MFTTTASPGPENLGRKVALMYGDNEVHAEGILTGIWYEWNDGVPWHWVWIDGLRYPLGYLQLQD